MSHQKANIGNQLAAKLGSFVGSISVKRNHRNILDPIHSPSKWKSDGVDHINIWGNAATELGQMLASGSKYSVNTPIFGRFCSLESFWRYITSEERDDRVRSMPFAALRKFSAKLNEVYVPNLKAIIADVNWLRVKQHPVIREAIMNSELPFDSYFTKPNGLRQRLPFAVWFISTFEEIRHALKEDREPDFSYLYDQPDLKLYEGVAPEPVPETEAEKNKPKQQPKAKKNKPKVAQTEVSEPDIAAEPIVPEVPVESQDQQTEQSLELTSSYVDGDVVLTEVNADADGQLTEQIYHTES